MDIAFFEFNRRELSAYENLAAGHALRLTEARLSGANASAFADAEIVSVFINSEIDRAILDQLPSLKLITTRSTGFDHIDTQLCAERGIFVSNVPVYGDKTVAEHVFALLLALSHRLPEAIDRVRHGAFSPEGLTGFDLSGKTLGVIGTGAIGKHVIKIAAGFGMKVIAFDLAPNASLAARGGILYLPFDDVLASADVLTLHVPSTPQTHGLLSAEAFAKIKHGAVLINTARGDLVDTLALIAALQAGRLAGAGLDVLSGEPVLREEAELICTPACAPQDASQLAGHDMLLNMPNVIITPHSAFNTQEALARITHTTIENIEAYYKGAPQNTVSHKRDPSKKERQHV